MDRRRFIFGAAVAGSALLAGCGGGGDSGGGTTGAGGGASDDEATGETAGDDEFQNTQPAQGTEQQSVEGGAIGGEGPTTLRGRTTGSAPTGTGGPETLTGAGNTTSR